MQKPLKEYFENAIKKLSWQITFAIGAIFFFIFLSVSSYFYIKKVDELFTHSLPDFTYWVQVGDQFQISRTIKSLETSDRSLSVVLKTKKKGDLLEKKEGISFKAGKDGVYIREQRIIKSDNGKVLGVLSFEISLPVLNSILLILILIFIVKITVSLLLKKMVNFSRELINPIEENLTVLNSYNLNDEKSKPQLVSKSKISEFVELNDTIQNLYKRIETQQSELDILNAIELKNEIAAQVAHDIRSPLSILKNIRGEISNLSEETKVKFFLGLKRIEDVSNSLLNAEENLTTEPLEIKGFIKSIISEKKLEFEKNLDLEIIENFNFNTQAYSLIKPSLLARVVSNLINNSKEAMSNIGKILIDIKENNDSIFIEIIDSGSGVSEDIQQRLFTKGVTNKANGNGLGLYGAKKELTSIDADLILEKTGPQGSIFKITLKKSSSQDKKIKMKNEKRPKEIVLIDDDKLIKFDWLNYMKTQGIPFHGFTSVSDFISANEKFPKDAEIFIDSSLGAELRGEIESEKLAKLGFENLYLSTGFEKSQIDKPVWIKEIYSKDPREIFTSL